MKSNETMKNVPDFQKLSLNEMKKINGGSLPGAPLPVVLYLLNKLFGI